MNGIGSGENGEITFLDTLSILSFYIALMNLNENTSQGDKQEVLEALSQQADGLLNEIHSHLQEQDQKIDKILEALYDS